MIWVNRTLCDVLEDMRKCQKTLNFAPMDGLIEEAQIMGNRMESALSDRREIKNWNEEWYVLKNEIKKLRKEKEELTGESE